MAHQIRIKLPTYEVANKGVEIDVRKNTRMLGTLLINKGDIEWRPAQKSVEIHRLTWAEFADLMKEQPVRANH